MSKRIPRDPRILNVMALDLIEFTTRDGRELIVHVDSIQAFAEFQKGLPENGALLQIGGLGIHVEESVSQILEKLLDLGRLREDLGDDVTEISHDEAIDRLFNPEADADEGGVDHV